LFAQNKFFLKAICNSSWQIFEH